ncbi:MAG: murein L,D-transpeptidase catalytic domain family protein [bacterium]
MLAFVLLNFHVFEFSTIALPLSAVHDEQTDREKFENYMEKIYEECKLTNKLDYRIFRLAMIGYMNMRTNHLLSDKNIIGVIDYTMSANDKRFFVIDLGSKEFLYHTLVAHGKNTGNKFAEYFSNEPRTQKSSLGFYITGEMYYGKHGYSLKLDGVDSSYNDNARIRQIIIHGANYVSDDWAKKYGRIGRSWGCPALPEGEAKEIIDIIKDGCCLFSYFDNEKYLTSSIYLNINGDLLQTLIGINIDG